MSGAKMAIQRCIFICKKNATNILSDSGLYELGPRNCFVVYIDGNSSVTHTAMQTIHCMKFGSVFQCKLNYSEFLII